MSAQRTSPLELLHEKIDTHGINALTASERWLFAICWFILETNGNAMHGYFFNQAGAHCREALQGLEIVGAHQTADLLRRAIALFPQAMCQSIMESDELRWVN